MMETTERKTEQGTVGEIPAPPVKGKDDPSRFTKKRSRKKKLIAAAVAVVIVAAGAWYIFGRKPELPPVSATALTRTDLRSTIGLTGTVESAQAVMVHAATSMAGRWTPPTWNWTSPGNRRS